MKAYNFVTTWRVKAPIEIVWNERREISLLNLLFLSSH